MTFQVFINWMRGLPVNIYFLKQLKLWRKFLRSLVLNLFISFYMTLFKLITLKSQYLESLLSKLPMQLIKFFIIHIGNTTIMSHIDYNDDFSILVKIKISSFSTHLIDSKIEKVQLAIFLNMLFICHAAHF